MKKINIIRYNLLVALKQIIISYKILHDDILIADTILDTKYIEDISKERLYFNMIKMASMVDIIASLNTFSISEYIDFINNKRFKVFIRSYFYMVAEYEYYKNILNIEKDQDEFLLYDKIMEIIKYHIEHIDHKYYKKEMKKAFKKQNRLSINRTFKLIKLKFKLYSNSLLNWLFLTNNKFDVKNETIKILYNDYNHINTKELENSLIEGIKKYKSYINSKEFIELFKNIQNLSFINDKEKTIKIIEKVDIINDASYDLIKNIYKHITYLIFIIKFNKKYPYKNI